VGRAKPDKKRSKRVIKRSILAGAIIAMAMTMYCATVVVDIYTKLAGAAVFAFALTYVKEQGLPLFTGKAGTDFPQKHLWGIVLPFNCLGSFLVTFPLGFCGYADNFKIIEQSAAGDTIPNMLIKAIFCGALMRIACSSKSGYVTMGCVFAFLASGFYHSIALSGALFGSIGNSTLSEYNIKGAIILLTVACIGNVIGAYFVTFFKGKDPVA
jgi:formate/nitrite transporter FocA (FNT family)